jgi:cyclase
MLKKRIIPCLLFNNRTIVKSVQFKNLRIVGDPTTCARVFNTRNADELIFLDIAATRENKGPNFKVIEDIARECFMPLCIGGGIRTIEEARQLFDIGADKIVINTRAAHEPAFITEISGKFGSQAVVVSIDAKAVDEGYQVFTSCGKVKTGYSPVELAIQAELLGAGEILLNSIDKDGEMNGYDLELIKQVSSAVNIPVIAAGGCGKLQDFVDAIKTGGADAVSAASIFFFVGESIITAKNYMNKAGIPVRLI